MYSKGLGGIELIDQRAAAYHLDRKSTIRFYLRIFFKLIDVACANSYIAYNLMHPNDLTLLEFKIIVSTFFIGRYTGRSKAPPDAKTGSKEIISISLSKVTYHHIFQSFKIFRDDVTIATKKEFT